MVDNLQKYIDLRQKYPSFTYEQFTYSFKKENRLSIEFHFSVDNSYHFRPKMELNLGNYITPSSNNIEIEGIIFHLGLIEMISYWKAFCSPIIVIKPYRLSIEQENWWKKLFRKGLGEFFFQNGISPDFANLITFEYPISSTYFASSSFPYVPTSQKVIVPIGGGKDSVVTLETLRKEKAVIPFIINPRGATFDCAKQAGFINEEDIIILQREIAPLLLELNKQGFLNGHTPFSAMLAFYTLLVATLTSVRDIALSNEASANEPTIPGTDINHQYSKSLEFETDFQYYVKTFMNDCCHYFSYLRPYTELEIAEKFATFTDYHFIFKSCNAGSKENRWCCSCSKCLFAYLILSPFIEDEKMIQIFGEDLLNKEELLPYFEELTGIAENKPFECVGTIDEVNKAVQMIKESRKEKLLIKHYFHFRH